MDPRQKQILPDVAQSQRSQYLSPLHWVGMEKISLPLTLGSGTSVHADADIFVNMESDEVKGIHMSRLYLSLQEGLANNRLTVSTLKTVLKKFVDSQAGLSDSAKIHLRWQELHNRKALLSEHSGWKTYPVELEAELNKGVLTANLKFSFFYSSTCPCSAALSRQLYQQEFSRSFSNENVNFDQVVQWLGDNQVASPHSQRSRADVQLKLKNTVNDIQILTYLDKLEEDIKTPVQTAVKRVDEQEFARLNGQNTMFVEDALRIMKNAMKSFSEVESFTIKAHHYESLHAHDAVGMVTSE